MFHRNRPGQERSPRKWGIESTPIQFPLQVAEYRAYEEELTRSLGMVKKRSFAPYQPDEVVFFNSNGRVEVGKVVMVFAHLSDRLGYFIPRFRVQVATKDGRWSAQWRMIWPGWIYDAYFNKDGTSRSDLPREVTLEWLRRKA